MCLFCGGIKVGVFFFTLFSLCNSMMDKKSMLCSFLFKIFSFAKDKIAQGNVNPVWLNVIDITFLTENEKDRPFTLLLVINSGETSRIYVNLMFISECETDVVDYETFKIQKLDMSYLFIAFTKGIIVHV